jgi:hypothetical protein
VGPASAGWQGVPFALRDVPAARFSPLHVSGVILAQYTDCKREEFFLRFAPQIVVGMRL